MTCPPVVAVDIPGPDSSGTQLKAMPQEGQDAVASAVEMRPNKEYHEQSR